MTHHPTRSFPFGRNVDTLIVCRDEDQRVAAAKALGIRARYETLACPLLGSVFDRIIVLVGTPESAVEAALLDKMVREYFPTKLSVEGRLHVL